MSGMIQPIAGPYGPYDDYIRQASEQYGLDPNMLHSLIQNESGMNPNAVSPKGAMGLGQLMPGTAQDLGVTDPFNPAQNIGGAGKYLGQMMDQFHDPRMALAGYNAGPGNVQKYGGIPPFQETQNYVQNVMRDAQPPQAPMAAMASPSPDFGMNPMQDMPPMPPQYAPSKSFAPGASPTLESSFNGGAKLAPGAISAEEFSKAPASAGMASSVGDFFKSTPGLMATGAALMGTDFEDPHSIGANAGSVGGAALGSMFGPVGSAVGGAAGGFLGDTIGGLFGDSSEEKAQKEAKKKKEEQYLLASMRRTSDMMRQGQLDRRQAMDNITRYLQQTNAA